MHTVKRLQKVTTKLCLQIKTTMSNFLGTFCCCYSITMLLQTIVTPNFQVKVLNREYK